MNTKLIDVLNKISMIEMKEIHIKTYRNVSNGENTELFNAEGHYIDVSVMDLKKNGTLSFSIYGESKEEVFKNKKFLVEMFFNGEKVIDSI